MTARRLPFFKLTGAGNDFVLVEGPVKRAPELAKRVCDRREGIGADGLLVVRRKPSPALEFFNPDGSKAFCGNGTRCAAWWLKGGKPSRSAFTLATSAGRLQARVTGRNAASIAMPAPGGIKLGLDVSAAGRRLTAHAVHTGTPHAVVFVDGLETYPVAEVGAAVRGHDAFAPEGVNANFARVDKGVLSLRTFEKGVEGETLACGTGAVAAAAAAALLRLVKPPVAVRALGGELTVSFNLSGTTFSDVWLEGPARLVFTGEIAL